MTIETVREMASVVIPKYLNNDRYEIISDYPNSDFREVGIVIELVAENTYNYIKYDITYCSIINYNPANYPNIFRKLQWWESREIEELPIYIRWVKNGKVTDVIVKGHWFYRSPKDLVFISEDDGFSDSPKDTLPATKEEYDNYIKSTL